MNETIGTEGLHPTLLVYGAISRSAFQGPAASKIALAEAMDKAHNEIIKEKAKRFAAFVLRQSYGLKAKAASGRSSIPNDTIMYGLRWVDTLNAVGKDVKSKSRLLARNFRDEGPISSATKSPIVSCPGQKITLTIAALMPGDTLQTLYITQAYLQSDSCLERNVYMRAPAEMGLDDD